MDSDSKYRSLRQDHEPLSVKYNNLKVNYSDLVKEYNNTKEDSELSIEDLSKMALDDKRRKKTIIKVCNIY